jgi:hypothetical protein
MHVDRLASGAGPPDRSRPDGDPGPEWIQHEGTGGKAVLTDRFKVFFDDTGDVLTSGDDLEKLVERLTRLLVDPERLEFTWTTDRFDYASAEFRPSPPTGV